MYCIFPVLKPLACGRQSQCLGWTYKLPGGQKFSIKTFASFCRISTEKTFKFNKMTPVYELPRGAVYKPPCAQLINNTFFAIHQVFALSTELKTNEFRNGFGTDGRLMRSRRIRFPKKKLHLKARKQLRKQNSGWIAYHMHTWELTGGSYCPTTSPWPPHGQRPSVMRCMSVNVCKPTQYVSCCLCLCVCSVCAIEGRLRIGQVGPKVHGFRVEASTYNPFVMLTGKPCTFLIQNGLLSTCCL